MRLLNWGWVVVFLAVAVGAIVGVVYGQPGTKASLELYNAPRIEQRVQALETELTTTKSQLSAANAKITALESQDKVKIVQFLGTRTPEGIWDAARVEVIDTNGDAQVAQIPGESVFTQIPHGVSK